MAKLHIKKIKTILLRKSRHELAIPSRLYKSKTYSPLQLVNKGCMNDSNVNNNKTITATNVNNAVKKTYESNTTATTISTERFNNSNKKNKYRKQRRKNKLSIHHITKSATTTINSDVVEGRLEGGEMTSRWRVRRKVSLLFHAVGDRGET
uniref:Uncharacterized protein n=1 Tax=Octopus bimaculoides TaxID=37653 RepID=A0A0L8G8Y3_OCTBM